MNDLLIWVPVFIVSIAILILAARFFTQSAEVIGLSLGMSPFAVGVVIVSVGTSLPELISSVIAVSTGSSEIVAGNICGSSISNLFFVLGLTTVFSKKSIQLGDQYIFIDLHFLLGSVALLAVMMLDGVITWTEGIIALAGYIIYTTYLLREGSAEQDLLLDKSVQQTKPNTRVQVKEVAIIAIGAFFIFLGAKYTIEALENIADAANISKAVVSVTVLSLGTTLPEAVVSATAAAQGKGDIAVGNILGSCIFNAMAITGVASLIGNVSAPTEILRLPLPIHAVGALLFYLLTQDKNISRWEGFLFLLIYILFIEKISGLV